MRWLFHLVLEENAGGRTGGRYAPASLAGEGFIHASYKHALRESARLYFPADSHARLRVLAVDPRRLDVPVDVVDTPRGPMPHILGSIPNDAIHEIALDDLDAHPDHVSGTRICFVAFEGMTLLDLVGPLDALSRIATMGIDVTTTCEVVSMTDERTGLTATPQRDSCRVWSAWGLDVRTKVVRPSLEPFDVLVVPGGPGTRALVDHATSVAWLATFPPTRLAASVCTGALLLGAAGRLRGLRATTHHTMLDALAQYGASPVRERVVDEGQIVTAAGVTAGIDLGVHLVRRLAGDDAAAKVAAQMELPRS